MKWPVVSVFIIVAVLGIGAALMSRQVYPPSSSDTFTSQPDSQQKTVQATITLEPSVSSISVGEEVLFNLKVQAQNVYVVGVETYLTYDPTTLEISVLEPGSLLPQAKVLLNTIDPSTGNVAYALGSLTPTFADGVAYVVKARALKPTTNLQSVLSIDRTQTKVALASTDGNERYSEKQTQLVFSEQPFSILP